MPFGINTNPYEAEDPREAEREQATPILDHIYTGLAWRTTPAEYERITGAFRVIDSGEQFAIVGNGEHPETCWMIFSDNLDRLEQA